MSIQEKVLEENFDDDGLACHKRKQVKAIIPGIKGEWIKVEYSRTHGDSSITNLEFCLRCRWCGKFCASPSFEELEFEEFNASVLLESLEFGFDCMNVVLHTFGRSDQIHYQRAALESFAGMADGHCMSCYEKICGRSAYLYLLDFGEFFKIGITTKSNAKQRITSHLKRFVPLYRPDHSYYWHGERNNIRHIELALKDSFKPYWFNEQFDGYTEYFPVESKKEIVKAANEMFDLFQLHHFKTAWHWNFLSGIDLDATLESGRMLEIDKLLNMQKR